MRIQGSREFVGRGEGSVVGLLNGREANRVVDGQITYGEFAVGLMVYDCENGDVQWISEEPFIRDPHAESITFASAFRQTAANRGLIYAHVDDAYVRAYRVAGDSLSSFLPRTGPSKARQVVARPEAGRREFGTTFGILREESLRVPSRLS